MKVLYSYDTPMPDTGADTEQVFNTVSALARRGMTMGLLIPGPRSGPGDLAALQDYYQTSGPVSVHLLGWRYHGLRALEKWSHAARAPRHPAVTGSDLTYTRNLPGAWHLLRAGHRVVYEHFRPWGDQHPPLQPFLRAVLRHPRLTAAIFHSRHALESYRRIGISDARMLVAHNGWDPGRMEPRLSRADARDRLGLDRDRFTVVYTGRISPRKGLELLLQAADGTPEMTYVLVGSEGEGPVERAARARPNVRVAPWQRFRDLAPWLYAADVLVIPPSLAPLERHGNTVLPLKLFLYLAAGRVILAPQAPDTAELLRDGINSLIVPPGNAAATIDALRSLAGNPARAERLAAGATATAEALTWDARAARIEEFLLQRLSAPADPPGSDPWTVGRWARETARWLIP